jgi:transcription-repair coupling factor (superfamily II helicase)
MTNNHYITVLNRWINEREEEVFTTGLSGTALAYFMAELIVETERPIIILLPKATEAAKFFRGLEFFSPETYVTGSQASRRIYEFPIYDISPLAGLSPHRNIINRRLQALYSLTADDSPVIITSLEAALLKIMPQNSLIKTIEYLEPGKDISRETLIKKLETGGYIRTSLVEEAGDYSVRGGVIDIFSPLYSAPVRLEFWGDRIESIRYFDSLTQRSTEKLDEMILLPSSEIIMDEEGMKRARSMGRLPEQFMDGTGFPGQEAWLNHFYSNPESLFDYFPADGIIAFIDNQRIDTEREAFVSRFHKDVEKYREEAEERGMVFPETEGILLSDEELDSAINRNQRIYFNELTINKTEVSGRILEVADVTDVDFDLELRLSGRGRVSMAPLAEKISLWQDQGARTILVCRTEQQAARLREILNNYDVDVDEIVENWYRASPRKKIIICLGRLSRGFAWEEIGLYVISEDEIFGPKRTRFKKRSEETGLDWTSFSQLRIDDLVVHEDHGIGKYGGLTRMEVEKKVNDFVIIEYAGNDRLYIPADRISVIQRYVGADDKNPKLDRLGGKSWKVVKQKAKRAIREIARQLVEIYALRKYRKGFSFSRPDNYFREFEAAFEHEETPDQIKAIDDVLSDMESEKPMDRLICGDVGFGKTEVAIRAGFKAISDGKQAAMLVPTTVLAEQHFETIKERMEPYGIKVEVLSRFKSRKEQKEIIARVRSGMVNFL